MKLDIVTLHDDSYRIVGSAASLKMREYADRHCYKFLEYECSLNTSRHTSWSKIPLVRSRIDKGADWILWCDSDTRFVSGNPIDAHLKVPDYADMFVSTDSCGICCGVFGVRGGSEWARSLLDSVDFLGPVNPTHWKEVGSDPRVDKFEQSTFKALLRLFRSVSDKVYEVPDSIIQNPESSYSNSALIYHYWMGGRSQKDVADLIMDKTPWSPSVLERSRL